MELIKVDSVPDGRTRHDCRFARLVKEFVESDMGIARVDFGSKQEARAAANCFRHHAKRKPFNAYMRGYSVYLEKC